MGVLGAVLLVVGLAVFPLQIVALLVRGLVFEYIGLTALGASLTLYRRHVLSLRRTHGAESFESAIPSIS